MGGLGDYPSDLNEVLYRLIYHRSYRDLFVSDPHELKLDAETTANLFAIDREELMGTARRVRQNVLTGDGVAGGLTRSYSMVFSILADLGVRNDDVAEAFMESECFRDFHDLPFVGTGITLEEAFYEFLSGDEHGLPTTDGLTLWLQHEFLTALTSLMVLNPDPNFVWRTPLVRHNGVANYAVVRYPAAFIGRLAKRAWDGESPDSLYLYASGTSGLVTGPISEVAGAIIERGSMRPEEYNVDTALNIEPNQSSALANQLRQLGLLE